LSKTAIHPKAYLTTIRNMKRGLISRTKIIIALEPEEKTASQICKDAHLTYPCVTHHLRALRKEKLIKISGIKKPYRWTLTKAGQQRLV